MPSDKSTGSDKFWGSIDRAHFKASRELYNEYWEDQGVTITKVTFKVHPGDCLLIVQGYLDGAEERVAFISGEDFFTVERTFFNSIGNKSLNWKLPKKWDN